MSLRYVSYFVHSIIYDDNLQRVNTRTEESMQSLFDQLLKLPVILKYPHFGENLKSLWTKRYAWAHCYRKRLLKVIRGNHTNNLIIMRSRKKSSYFQMFIFVYDIMDMYYQKKLIAISNHRFETSVSLLFQGLNIPYLKSTFNCVY